MPTTLYEQFFAAGSVKSLLTGAEIKQPILSLKTNDPSSDQSPCPKSEQKPLLKK